MNLAHAPIGGLVEYDKRYLGGQFLPFYVPRERMPQFDEAVYPQLVIDAMRWNSCQFDTVPPLTLHAHQRIDHRKAERMDPKDRIKPMIVSGDGYIVDGNHRWWANVYSGSPFVNVIRLTDDFDSCIEWALKLPYVYEINQTKRTQR